MAETTAPAPDSAKEAKKPSGHRPDLATLGGSALALAGILGGLVLEQGKVKDVAQLTAAIIVLGGTLGALSCAGAAHPVPQYFDAAHHCAFHPCATWCNCLGDDAAPVPVRKP